jgi:hypothetical protein
MGTMGKESTQASLGQKVVAFATNRVGQQVGSGECFDLADLALRNAGAIAADADYRWGTAVNLLDVQAGDILQFRNYSVTVEVVTKTKKKHFDGSEDIDEETSTETYSRPHHTAIVSAKVGATALRVFEQNAPPRGGSTSERVNRLREIDVRSSESTIPVNRQETDGIVTGETKTKITVTGTIQAYRPTT